MGVRKKMFENNFSHRKIVTFSFLQAAKINGTLKVLTSTLTPSSSFRFSRRKSEKFLPAIVTCFASAKCEFMIYDIARDVFMLNTF